MKNKEEKLDWDHLFDLLDYNPETGIFINKITRNSRAVIGNIAGNKDPKGYIIITIEGEKYQAHRLAWFYEYGKWPTNILDHKNRIKSDNWIDNLREATVYQNNQNRSQVGNTSKYHGVYFDISRGKWSSAIMCNNKRKLIGRFNTEEEAAIAYNIESVKLHKEFAVLNKI